ncbi:MAG: phosphate signaling complex protein PhoU [Alphaproteobacteria bacterium]|nr:phosphate signaling complex protein PhoU [Alphaproteobacteria bacterium]
MGHEHIVGRFDQDLQKIKALILKMGALVNAQIKGATDALMDFETAEVDALVATDRKINGMNKDVDNRAERLIALRQPMALDLREAMLPIKIAGELERIGDHAKSTAKRVRKLTENTSAEEALTQIGEMSAKVQSMLTDALVAYRDSDIALCAEIRARDLEIDALNKAIFAQTVTALTENPQDAETLVHMVLLARSFERAGDHVVNISRQVHHIVTGEDLKASS